MRIEALVPDVARGAPQPSPDASAFAGALDAAGALLSGAENAEDSFAAGTGNLQASVYARAQADVALSVATAAAQRSAQALQSILNMQV